MQTDLVSIVTPAFNSASFIGETIRSVLEQTHKHWEMIIVIDSGTTDNTSEVVSKFTNLDARIKLIIISDGRGISLSRNKALSMAKGEFIAFLDSDDLWLPEKLEKQIAFMRSTQSNFSCTGFRKLSQDGSRIGILRLPPILQNYYDLLRNNLISCPTAMFNQKNLGSSQMKESAHEDYLFWLELVKKAGFCNGLQEDLARYRVVEQSRSMTVNRPGTRWKIYHEIERIGLFKSIYYFTFYSFNALRKRISF